MSPFTPKDWKDFPNTTTPLNRAALVDMEARLAAYTDVSASGVPITGLIGDGTTDNTAAVQAALNAAPTGTTLTAPSGGTYAFNDAFKFAADYQYLDFNGSAVKSGAARTGRNASFDEIGWAQNRVGCEIRNTRVVPPASPYTGGSGFRSKFAFDNCRVCRLVNVHNLENIGDGRLIWFYFSTDCETAGLCYCLGTGGAYFSAGTRNTLRRVILNTPPLGAIGEGFGVRNAVENCVLIAAPAGFAIESSGDRFRVAHTWIDGGGQLSLVGDEPVMFDNDIANPAGVAAELSCNGTEAIKNRLWCDTVTSGVSGLYCGFATHTDKGGAILADNYIRNMNGITVAAPSGFIAAETLEGNRVTNPYDCAIDLSNIQTTDESVSCLGSILRFTVQPTTGVTRTGIRTGNKANIGGSRISYTAASWRSGTRDAPFSYTASDVSCSHNTVNGGGRTDADLKSTRTGGTQTGWSFLEHHHVNGAVDDRSGLTTTGTSD